MVAKKLADLMDPLFGSKLLMNFLKNRDIPGIHTTMRANEQKIELSFSQACDGLIRYKTAIGLSQHTIADYPVAFKKLSLYLKSDPPLPSIDREQLIGFFAWLQTDYITKPDGVIPRGKQKLSQKSILNIHTNLSSLWTWAQQEGYIQENLLRSIKRPTALPPVI